MGMGVGVCVGMVSVGSAWVYVGAIVGGCGWV